MTLSRPEIKEFTDLSLSFPESATLLNGIELWVVGNGEEDINHLDVIVPGGLLHERHAMLATSTAMCTAQGNSKMDQQQIAETLDYYGSWRQSHALDTHTEHSLFSLNDNFQNVLPVFNECLLTPSFPQQFFEVTRNQLAGNCAIMLERVSTLANIEMMRLYYGPEHPLSKFPAPDEIMQLSTDMLRKFHECYYRSAGTKAVISGRVTDKEIHAVENYLGLWPQTGPVEPVAFPINPSPVMMSIVDKPGAVQTAISMTLRAVPRRHEHYIKLRLLIMLFGGFFGSRLMANIREDKGYTYGISANLLGRSDDSYIAISTECDTAYTWPVVNEVKREMARLREELIPENELKVVKRHIMSDLAKTLDTPFKIASYVKGTFLNGTYPEYFNDQVRETLEATPQELRELARIYLREENLRIVLACDKSALPEQS